MASKIRVGSDGELLTPQSVPRPKELRTAWRRYFWLPLMGFGQLLATYTISPLVSAHSALYGLIMALSIVFFHITLMIWINWSRIPSQRRKKGAKAIKSRLSERFQLPSGVTILDKQAWYQKYPWWMSVIGLTFALGIFGLLFMLWITPISVFNTPIREIYTRGIPLQTTLEKFCRDEVAYGRNSRQVSYYHVFFYTTLYDLPNATEHQGKEYMSESECHSIPAGAPIYIHYLPESPSVYRVVAGAYQPYDPKNIDIIKTREANLSWLTLIGFSLLGACYAALVASSIANARRDGYIKENGELKIGVISTISQQPIFDKKGEKSSTRITFRFYCYGHDETVFWGKHTYSRNENGNPPRVAAGDHIVVAYLDDRNYLVL